MVLTHSMGVGSDRSMAPGLDKFSLRRPKIEAQIAPLFRWGRERSNCPFLSCCCVLSPLSYLPFRTMGLAEDRARGGRCTSLGP